MPNRSTNTNDEPVRPRSEFAAPARFTDHELRRIYRRLLAAAVPSGPPTSRRRRKLMRYASQIGIKPFDASLLIAEVQREAGQADPLESSADDDLTTLIHPERWPIWFKLSAALIIAMLVDLVAIRALGW
jgi:hypothetical protein